MKGKIVKHHTCVKAHPTNEEIEKIESMRVWIRKARIFRVIARKSNHQDIRMFGLIRQSEMWLCESQHKRVDKGVLAKSQKG